MTFFAWSYVKTYGNRVFLEQNQGVYFHVSQVTLEAQENGA